MMVVEIHKNPVSKMFTRVNLLICAIQDYISEDKIPINDPAGLFNVMFTGKVWR